MGQAVYDCDVPFSPSRDGIAAVLCRTQHDNLHLGLIYRGRAGQAAFLHLGWQDFLCDDWGWELLWASPDELLPEQRDNLAALCRHIWRQFQRERRFPYQIRYAGTHFTPTGQLVFGPGARGLTCATFVLAVFASIGVELVDERTWPVRADEDRGFLARIQRFASPAHYAILAQEVEEGCQRIRPDEVIAACTLPALPGGFEAVLEAAHQVRALLERQPTLNAQ